jgi:hypothetical protein
MAVAGFLRVAIILLSERGTYIIHNYPFENPQQTQGGGGVFLSSHPHKSRLTETEEVQYL